MLRDGTSLFRPVRLPCSHVRTVALSMPSLRSTARRISESLTLQSSHSYVYFPSPCPLRRNSTLMFGAFSLARRCSSNCYHSRNGRKGKNRSSLFVYRQSLTYTMYSFYLGSRHLQSRRVISTSFSSLIDLLYRINGYP